MIAFDVCCNDTFLCRMGLPELQSVLTLSLTSHPQQDSASLLAMGKTKTSSDLPDVPSEADKLAHFQSQMRDPMPMWLSEELIPPLKLEIRVIETDDVESISEHEFMSADPAAINPRILNLFAQLTPNA